MPRAGRSFEEGRIYHVYNRVGAGAKVFSDEEMAAVFVALLRLAVRRDEAAGVAVVSLGYGKRGRRGVVRCGARAAALVADGAAYRGGTRSTA